MNSIQSSQLVLKSVNQLFENSFYIPAYQRGYRWTDTQVIQLLNDIWQFAKNPPLHEPGKENPFYCLQPIVVKKRADNEWEVIDGQQRLTTIYLILKNLQNQIERDQKNFTRIFYETRLDSENYLRNIEHYTETEADENIDYFHIYKAYHTINKWFQNIANHTEDASPRAVFTPVLLRDTKVIWYEVEENYSNNSIDIFTRLNIGKIPLTNSELIKALLLKRENFSKEKSTLKQVQIASEWDLMEQSLQDDSFWYFLYNPKNSIKYDNRIEYIFDLIKERKRDSEHYHTFNKFYEEFTIFRKNNKPDIDKIWIEIKKYYLTFKEWYNDFELYHYIGYLIDCGIPIELLMKESFGKTKTHFKDLFLRNEIRKQVVCEIENLEYGDKQVKKVLLLFNILSLLDAKNSDFRFPFNKYKLENWEIEHVSSQTDKTINGKEQLNWVNDILDYFAGLNEIQGVQNYLTTLDGNNDIEREIQNICNALIKFKTKDSLENEEFDDLFKLVQKFFHEGEQLEDKDDISNLTLLDAATNRSYKNSFFPIKRKRIINNDSQGIFVPIATKNLFLKYYSNKLGEVMYWSNSDGVDYLEALKKS